MRIIVWGINYSPELTGIAPYNTALCDYLASRGYNVEMVTSFPYYPAWKKNPDDEGFFYRTDQIGGVKVHRCWHYVPRRVASWKRIIHEATFVLTSLLRVLTLSKADAVVVISPPLLLGTAAWLVSKLKGAPYLFHVQDLQPDAAMSLGLLRKGLFLRMLYKIEGFAYSKAAKVSGISQGMVKVFRGKDVSEKKLTYFPNGVRLPEASQIPPRGRFRERHQIGKDDFVAVYSGNLGLKQGLDILVQAAALIDNKRIKIFISGDGAYRHALMTQVKGYDLPHVTMLPIQPEESYREMLVDADVCLITQLAQTGAFFFPSKLLTTLAFKKPIISVADDESELAVVAKQGQFGLNIHPNEPAALAESISHLAQNPALLEQMGEAGYQFVRQFEMASVLSNYEESLLAVVQGRNGKHP